MALPYGPCGQIIVSAAGSKIPTALTANLGLWVGGRPAIEICAGAGCEQSSSITSATLTDAFTPITGSGVISFAALHTSSATTTTDSKFRIIIDGNTVLDDSGDAITDQDGAKSAIGSVTGAQSGGGVAFSESTIIFNTSLSILIAGDGTNGVTLSHKLYLTG